MANLEATRGEPRELNRLEVLRGLRIATWEASFATVWATLTTGVFLTGYALWLKADDVAMGLLTAIPTFAGLAQIISSYWGERLRSRKPITAWFSLAGRGLWALILLLPWLMPRSAALYPFLFLFALSYVFLNIPAPAYMAWMSDLVPPDHRGRYFGRRNMIAGITGMVLGLPAARFLDFTTKGHDWGAFGYGTLFALGVVGGVLSFVCLLRQPEPPPRVSERAADAPKGLAGVLAYYRTPFTDRNFVALMAFNVIFGLGQFFAAPFYMVYAVKHLNIDYVWLQICATLTSVASLSSMPLWGYLADKFGSKPLLAIGVFGTSTLPLYWLILNPSKPGLMLALLAILNLSGGFSWAGVQLTQFNLLIGASPAGKTPVYVATMSAITGLTGGLAPMAGSLTMRLLDGWQAPFLGLLWRNFHLVFFVSAFLRLVSLLLLRSISDSQAASTREVLQQLRQANPRAWRNIRRLQKGAGAEAKLKATEALAESRTALAIDELQAALRDPNPQVRSEAAHALGEIGDAGAVNALLTMLQDPAAGLVSEAARALGRIGDRRASIALIAILNEGALSNRERLAVAQALGDLGGSDAARALLAELERTEDEEVKEAAVRALGAIGERRAVSVLVRLLSQNPPRPLALALVRSLGEIGDAAALPALRECLKTEDADPALLPTLADALARLEDRDSLLALLSHLNALQSPVARKQVAVAIGNLLGEGENAYILISQEGFARDEAVSRMIQDLLRKTKTALELSEPPPLVALYVSGDYAGFMEAMRSLLEATPDSIRQTLAGTFVDTATRLPETASEEALLTVIALRAAMSVE